MKTGSWPFISLRLQVGASLDEVHFSGFPEESGVVYLRLSSPMSEAFDGLEGAASKHQAADGSGERNMRSVL